MGTTSANFTGESLNERSIDDLDELAALARMVTYARYVAQDVELASAIHWLDLALQAINREILDIPNAAVRDFAPFGGAAQLKAH
ncbi:hypothetical protein QTL95_06390 [Rhizobium sp. S152]|uniref:hypothetical protein n=1 Tax=Rhizobium sp. S152 TaxID=3055038 RepID=UPI0025A9D706|nr:hypothetical protein [Rhizobium sp. S152]MDM9625515.1 hypothetical protein [Rhizobium sp. S152]